MFVEQDNKKVYSYSCSHLISAKSKVLPVSIDAVLAIC